MFSSGTSDDDRHTSTTGFLRTSDTLCLACTHATEPNTEAPIFISSQRFQSAQHQPLVPIGVVCRMVAGTVTRPTLRAQCTSLPARLVPPRCCLGSPLPQPPPDIPQQHALKGNKQQITLLLRATLIQVSSSTRPGRQQITLLPRASPIQVSSSTRPGRQQITLLPRAALIQVSSSTRPGRQQITLLPHTALIQVSSSTCPGRQQITLPPHAAPIQVMAGARWPWHKHMPTGGIAKKHTSCSASTCPQAASVKNTHHAQQAHAQRLPSLGTKHA